MSEKKENVSEKEHIFGGSIPDKVLLMGEWNNSPLNFFARYDGPYVNRDVTIGNHALRKILRKNFEYMSRNLNFISSFGRFLLGTENIEAILQAEEIASNTIQNAMDSVNRRIAAAEGKLKIHEINEITQNGKLQTMQVPLTSPGARKYVELLVRADYFYNLNALLWINGEIDDRFKFENESIVRKEVQASVRGIANQFGYILNLTRKKDPKEAAKVGEHDEEKLASDAESQLGDLGNSMTSSDKVDSGSTAETSASGKKKKPAKDVPVVAETTE